MILSWITTAYTKIPVKPSSYWFPGVVIIPMFDVGLNTPPLSPNPCWANVTPQRWEHALPLISRWLQTSLISSLSSRQLGRLHKNVSVGGWRVVESCGGGGSAFLETPPATCVQCARGSETVCRSRGDGAPDVPRTPLQDGVEGGVISGHHDGSKPAPHQPPTPRYSSIHWAPPRNTATFPQGPAFQGWTLECGIGNEGLEGGVVAGGWEVRVSPTRPTTGTGMSPLGSSDSLALSGAEGHPGCGSCVHDPLNQPSWWGGCSGDTGHGRD